MKIYNDICIKYLLLKRKSNRRNLPWVNKNIRREIKLKHKMWYKLCQNKNTDAKHSYKRQCRTVKKMLRDAKIQYECILASKSKTDPKLIYSYIRGKMCVKEHVKAMRTAENMITTNKDEVVEMLNNQFKSVFVREPDAHLPDFSRRTQTVLSADSILEVLNIEEIRKRLLKLDADKAVGADGIHPAILKNCAASLSRPLLKIYVKSIQESVVPSDWKTANITPIFKSGSKLEAQNYRPISLTSIVCKVMEGIIRDVLMKYLTLNNLISKWQHGFVPKKCCTTNLLETLDLITYELARGNCVDEILLDLAKAFDKVPHKRLLLKLRAYGFSDDILAWFKSFLTKRKQRVILADYKSEWAEVLSGVLCLVLYCS